MDSTLAISVIILGHEVLMIFLQVFAPSNAQIWDLALEVPVIFAHRIPDACALHVYTFDLEVSAIFVTQNLAVSVLHIQHYVLKVSEISRLLLSGFFIYFYIVVAKFALPFQFLSDAAFQENLAKSI